MEVALETSQLCISETTFPWEMRRPREEKAENKEGRGETDQETKAGREQTLREHQRGPWKPAE